jgi:hypothetical protein
MPNRFASIPAPSGAPATAVRGAGHRRPGPPSGAAVRGRRPGPPSGQLPKPTVRGRSGSISR